MGSLATFLVTWGTLYPGAYCVGGAICQLAAEMEKMALKCKVSKTS